MGDEQRREIVKQVRSELIRAALSAYEDAGMRGLCAEGAWEVAVSAMRSLDLSPALKSPSPPK